MSRSAYREQVVLTQPISLAQNNYQNEQSEKWIGEWIQARKNRDLLVLATK